MSSCYLVSYDLSNDKHRLKVAHLLEGYGERVQYSVFEIWATAQQLEKLGQQLRRYVEDEGSIRIYPLCRACAKRRQVLGEGQPTTLAELHLI